MKPSKYDRVWNKPKAPKKPRFSGKYRPPDGKKLDNSLNKFFKKLEGK